MYHLPNSLANVYVEVYACCRYAAPVRLGISMCSFVCPWRLFLAVNLSVPLVSCWRQQLQLQVRIIHSAALALRQVLPL